MSLPVVLRRAARAEFDDAVDWYEERRRSLGLEFLESIEDLLKRIGEAPERHPPVFQDVRRLAAQRFPYSVFYKVEPKRVVVLAIFHSSRDPKIWRERA